MTSVHERSAIPSDYTETETVMSNFDHSIERDVADRLESGPYFAQYSGWDFCGYVWKDGPLWACEVWTYHEPQEVIRAETLEEIMEQVSATYGDG